MTDARSQSSRSDAGVRCGPCRWLAAIALASVIGSAAWAKPDSPADAAEPEIRVTGMTFVASRDEKTELLLRADTAEFAPDGNTATLHGVHATVSGRGDQLGFEMRCDRGTLDFNTNNFHAAGNVRGRTDDGRQFETEWVKYDDEKRLLFTEESVVIREDSGAVYRGGGFEYYVSEQRFRLIGGAELVQEP